MSDLISRQAAIDALEEQIEQCNKSLSSFDISIKDEFAVKVERASLVAFRETLEYLPSAQPEIIRCRDCRYWYTGDGYNHENGAQCALTHMWMSPDDYCSYGRRKVSETDG